MIRRERIGLDIDGDSQLNILKKYFNAKRIGRTKLVSTRNGNHIEVESNHSMIDKMTIRQTLGDCRGRFWYDELRMSLGYFGCVDTLFEEKTYRDGSYSQEEEVDILSLPFWGSKIYLKRR